MKFLLIGDGFIAPRHKDAIKEIGGEIAGIIDESRGENKWREEIQKTDAEYAVVLTPNDLHYQMAKFAAENGKIVLCEKPLAIKSSDAGILAKYKNVFTVLQLRYHPDILKIRAEAIKSDKNEVEMDISVFRDENYYKCWKGQKERSGGVLFNLGVHYFDLLIYLFGEPIKAKVESLDEKTGTGTIEGENYMCKFRISTGEEKGKQKRIFKINGRQFNFSSKENLSYENLYGFLYRDLIDGKGISVKEAQKSISLIEKLYGTQN